LHVFLKFYHIRDAYVGVQKERKRTLLTTGVREGILLGAEKICPENNNFP